MRKYILFFLVGVMLAANSQEVSAVSPNNCDPPGRPFFRWTKMAIRPVDKPLLTFDDLVRFLSPTQTMPEKVWSQSWQQLAKSTWKWTDTDFNLMFMAALQGENSNFRKVSIQPCEVFEDMIFDIPPRPLGRAVLADWEDKKPKDAWVWQISDIVEGYFFEGCANPAWKARIPTPVEHPEEKVIEAPKPPAPGPPTSLQLPKGPIEVTLTNPPQCPAPQVNCQADVDVTNQHPITFNPTINVPPVQEVKVTVKRDVPWYEKAYYITGIPAHLAQIWQGYELHRINANLKAFRREFKVPGPSGKDGKDGRDGKEGPAGHDGKDGKDGPAGPAGKDGRDGKDGPPGKDGPQGPAGKDGKQGPAGPTGPQGPPGKAGKDGQPGPRGPEGPAGPTGPQGPAGPTGPQGPPGLTPKPAPAPGQQPSQPGRPTNP